MIETEFRPNEMLMVDAKSDPVAAQYQYQVCRFMTYSTSKRQALVHLTESNQYIWLDADSVRRDRTLYIRFEQRPSDLKKSGRAVWHIQAPNGQCYCGRPHTSMAAMQFGPPNGLICEHCARSLKANR